VHRHRWFNNAPLSKIKRQQYSNLKRTRPPNHREENKGFPSKIVAERGTGTILRGEIDIHQLMGYYRGLISVQGRRAETYATVDPMNQTNGRNENALAIFESSASSPMAVFNTPIFPFNAPANALLIIIAMNEWDSPKLVSEMVSPSNPVTRTGLRPIRSERRPHWRIQTASVK
jgi:hypothetical protein